MRILIMALSVVAGVILFMLFAKLLVSGLFFVAALAFFGFLIKKLRYYTTGTHSPWRGPDTDPSYQYPAQQQYGFTETGAFRYRTIVIQ